MAEIRCGGTVQGVFAQKTCKCMRGEIRLKETQLASERAFSEMPE